MCMGCLNFGCLHVRGQHCQIAQAVKDSFAGTVNFPQLQFMRCITTCRAVLGRACANNSSLIRCWMATVAAMLIAKSVWAMYPHLYLQLVVISCICEELLSRVVNTRVGA